MKQCLCEKCWKGYVKRGMKTLFGKKYPNCVKKSKAGKRRESVKEAERKMSSLEMQQIILLAKAMKQMPGSPAQKKIKQQINVIRKKLGQKPVKESLLEKMGPKELHAYMQHVFDTQFKTADDKKMKKTLIKKINIGQKKKGLPLFKESINEESKTIKSIQNLADKNKYGTVSGTRMNGKTAKEIIAIYNHPKMKSFRGKMDKMKSHELMDLTIRLPKMLGIKVESVNEKVDKIGAIKKAFPWAKGKMMNVIQMAIEMDVDGLAGVMKNYKANPSAYKQFVRDMSKMKGLPDLKEAKGVEKIMQMANDKSFGKLAGRTVDGMTANLFKQVYDKAPQNAKDKIDKMNEKQLYVFMGKLWSKFGRQVRLT